MPYEKRFDTVLDLKGNPVANAQIRVLEYPDGGEATIYSDRSGVNPVANPLVADNYGFFEYYAADGTYTWEITTNLGTRVINDILHGNAGLDVNGVGYVVTDGSDLFTRTLTVSGDGLSALYGDGQSGNTVFSLANDVAAIEALTGTGFLQRTGVETWSLGDVQVDTAVTIIALQDAASRFVAITTGTDKDVLETAPAVSQVLRIWASNGTPGTVQSTVIDVNINGTSILSTKLTIEAGEESTDTAANQPVLSTTSWSHGDRLSVDYDQVGTGVLFVTVYMAVLIDESAYR